MSCLDYWNYLLYGLPSSLIPKLQHMQNSVTRLVYTAPRFCHITPLLTKLHWLNIEHRIDFKIILIMYKAIHGAAPPYISDLTSLKLNSKYGLRSKDTLLPQLPSVRTSPTLGNWAFSTAAPKLWNSLTYLLDSNR